MRGYRGECRSASIGKENETRAQAQRHWCVRWRDADDRRTREREREREKERERERERKREKSVHSFIRSSSFVVFFVVVFVVVSA